LRPEPVTIRLSAGIGDTNWADLQAVFETSLNTPNEWNWVDRVKRTCTMQHLKKKTIKKRVSHISKYFYDENTYCRRQNTEYNTSYKWNWFRLKFWIVVIDIGSAFSSPIILFFKRSKTETETYFRLYE
jgi:hypothetical protein